MRISLWIGIVSLTTLLFSQGYGLYNMYRAENKKVQTIIEEQILEAIKLELSGRITHDKPKDPNNPKFIIKSANDMTPEERAKLKGDTITLSQVRDRKLNANFVDLFSQRLQDGLYNSNRPIRANVLDSLFRNQLKKRGLDVATRIEVYDSTKQHVINRVGELSNRLYNQYHTEILPIGTFGLLYIQGTIELPLFKPLQNMLYSFILSCLVIFISTMSLYFLLKMIRRTHDLLREREIAVHSAIHDLKSPLNTAYASMDFIASQEKELLKISILNAGKAQLRQLIEVIESMLSLLKTPDGKVALNLSSIEVIPFVEQLFYAILKFYPEKNIQFHIEKRKDFPDTIFTDRIRLERCFRNLLENALKYSDQNVQITVNLEIRQEHLRIAIEDTGWGIPKKAQKKVEQQFFRVRQADKPAQPGYGLGLSCVKLLVKEMGGSMSFHSEEGIGSTFFINLPFHKK